LRFGFRAIIVKRMPGVTQLLNALEHGDQRAASQLLPLVYDELRALAAQKLAQERPGQTLQPTALVHEAYLRLVGADADKRWDGRGHFFAAAAEAMRRILVESARHKRRHKHGGDRQRVELADQHLLVLPPPERMLELDEALTRLAAEDPAAAEVVKLHFFAGLSLEQVAECIGHSRATAYRQWAYARAWLRCELGQGDEAANF
jgi:RNA polymerase sigma factor (TIGR02999 family)